MGELAVAPSWEDSFTLRPPEGTHRMSPFLTDADTNKDTLSNHPTRSLGKEKEFA
jgi:hypothetical protein